MYRKSPRKFERKFQCKIFHGRPLFVEVPKIRTSPNASFWLIWPNWDMKGMEMWPKAIMVWKYDGSRPTRPKIAEVSSPGPEIWFFYKKNQWFAIDPTVQHIQHPITKYQTCSPKTTACSLSWYSEVDLAALEGRFHNKEGDYWVAFTAVEEMQSKCNLSGLLLKIPHHTTKQCHRIP